MVPLTPATRAKVRRELVILRFMEEPPQIIDFMWAAICPAIKAFSGHAPRKKSL
jgi:hypothetical protein